MSARAIPRVALGAQRAPQPVRRCAAVCVLGLGALIVDAKDSSEVAMIGRRACHACPRRATSGQLAHGVAASSEPAKGPDDPVPSGRAHNACRATRATMTTIFKPSRQAMRSRIAASQCALGYEAFERRGCSDAPSKRLKGARGDSCQYMYSSLSFHAPQPEIGRFRRCGRRRCRLPRCRGRSKPALARYASNSAMPR